MNFSSEIYELILTLSKDERYYINRFGLENNKRNITYRKLFDEICKKMQKPQDNFLELDEKLRLKYQNKFSGKFSAAKNYLLKNILEALVNIKKKESEEAQIVELINIGDTLYLKGLNAMAKRYYLKAYSKAKKRCRYELQLHILNRVHTYNTLDLDINYFDEVDETFHNLSRSIEYRKLYKSYEKFIFEHGRTSSKQQEKVLLKITENKLISEPKKFATDSYQQILASHVTRAKHFNFNNYKQSYDEMKAQQPLRSSYPYELYNKENDLLDYHIKLVLTSSTLRDKSTYKECINALLKLKLKERLNVLKRNESLYYFQIKNCLRSNELAKTTGYANQYEKHMQQFPSTLDKNILSEFCITVSMCYFLKNDFKKSLKWTEIHTNNFGQIPSQVNEILHTLSIFLCHFEMKNYLYLPSLVSSHLRFYKKKKELNDLEQTSINLIKELSKHPENHLAILVKFEPRLERLSKQRIFIHLLGRFDILVWIKSKIQNISMGDSYYNKYPPFT